MKKLGALIRAPLVKFYFRSMAESSMGLSPILTREILEIMKRINSEENIAVLRVEQKKSYRDVKHYKRRKRWLA